MNYAILSDNHYLINAIHAVCQDKLLHDSYNSDVIFVDCTAWHPPAGIDQLSGKGGVIVFIISTGHNSGRFVDYLDLSQNASYIISPEDSEISIRKLLVRIKINHVFNKKYGGISRHMKTKRLSYRELHIMDLIMFGHKDIIISDMLALNHKTVSRIRLEFLKKLNFNNVNIRTLPLVRFLLKINTIERNYV